MDYWYPPEGSQGPFLLRINVAFIVISSVIVAARLIIRAFVIRNLGIDDLVASVGLAFLLVFSSLEITAVFNGSGTRMDQVPPARLLKFFNMLPTERLLYFWGIGIVRLSVVAFYPRLKCNETWFIRSIYVMIFLITASTIIPFFFFLTDCKHIPDIWDFAAPKRHCRGVVPELRMLWAASAMGVFIDLCLLAIPIIVIWKTMKFSHQLAQVIIVFSVGIFATIASIVRLVILTTTDYTTDTTYKMITIGLWTSLEGHVGLWTACFPSLQPLIRYIGHFWTVLPGKASSSRRNTATKQLIETSEANSRNVSVV